MTRRHLLDVASKKKRDTMRSYAAIASAVNPGPLVMGGGASIAPAFGMHIVPWLATARDLDNSAGGGLPAQMAQRTATSCFMRGLRETIRLSTSTSSPWEWRRVCFTLKGNPVTVVNSTGVLVPYWYETAPDGWIRLALDLTASSATSDQLAIAAQLVTHIFEGTYGSDFSDILTAKLDTTKISVRYDHTTNIQSSNNSGTQNVFKRWHGMNHNLIYEDTENGALMTEGITSTEGRPGMGDFYVVDFFKPHPSATASDQLSFQPQATLYWHER